MKRPADPTPKPAGWSELLAAIDSLEGYKAAVLLVEAYGWTHDRKQLARARELLKRAITKRPNHAPSHAVLGYIYDQGGARSAGPALACMREARRLNPRDKIYEVYLMTLLEEAGLEQQALAAIREAAPRHGVDLRKARRELAVARFKADASALLLNSFIRARNFMKSRLADEAERILNRLAPGRARREAAAQHERCVQDQRELQRRFDASRVPEAFRALASWASRYGVGDDYCRPYLLKRLSKKQRAQLVRAVDRRAAQLHAWLDTFAEGKMTEEAAALMYLDLGAEEIRDA